jgi:hypothetical protein
MGVIVVRNRLRFVLGNDPSKLSKIVDYLIDNHYLIMLSSLVGQVNKKAAGIAGLVPNWESRVMRLPFASNARGRPPAGTQAWTSSIK